MSDRPDILKRDIRAALLEHPALMDDEKLRADFFDGEYDLPEKIGLIVESIHKREAFASACDAIVSRYAAEAGRHRGAVLGLRKLVREIFDAAALTSVRLPTGPLVSLAQSQPKVIITDEAAIPGDLMRVTREPNKKAIGDRLKAGEAIPGACLSNAEPYVRIG